MKTTVDTAYPEATHQCQRIVAGLRLAEGFFFFAFWTWKIILAVSHDEEFRNFHLIQAATAQLCSHILEFQFSGNPIVMQMAKPPTQRLERISDWRY